MNETQTLDEQKVERIHTKCLKKYRASIASLWHMPTCYRATIKNSRQQWANTQAVDALDAAALDDLCDIQADLVINKSGSSFSVMRRGMWTDG